MITPLQNTCGFILQSAPELTRAEIDQVLNAMPKKGCRIKRSSYH
ncbi:MAG: hypothetical protein JWQ21_3737 [Herminiimonas sp.]|nr:hypothetical protein [Herminiimonas sp.]